MNKIWIVLIAVAISLSSCTIEEKYHFKEDMSGSYEMALDMSALMSLADGLDEESMGSDMPSEDMFNELKVIAEKATGISNFKSSYDEGVAKMSFDFVNIEAIDQLNLGDENGAFFGKDKLNMRVWNNKMSFDLTPSDSLRQVMGDLNSDDSSSELGAMGDMGGEMFTFKSSLSFDRPIKRVKSKSAVHNASTNSVTYSYNIEDLSDSDKKWCTVIRFK